MESLPLHHLAEGLRCFVCGPESRHGLHLQFYLVGDHVEASWTATETLEGWPRLIHGAGFAALHDEAAAWAMVALSGRTGLTTQMDVRFLRPIRLGDTVTVLGRPHEVGSRSGTYATELRLADGTLASTARTTYAFQDAAALEALLGTQLSDRFAQWLAADPAQRRLLVQAWAREGAPAAAKLKTF